MSIAPTPKARLIAAEAALAASAGIPEHEMRERMELLKRRGTPDQARQATEMLRLLDESQTDAA